MAKIFCFMLILLAAAYVSDAYKILVVFPLPGKSHGILGDGVVRHLLNAGHEVSLITPFPKKDSHPNLKQIDVSDNLKLLPENMLSIKHIMEGKVSMDESIMLFIMQNIASSSLENENVKKVLADPNQHFDLVIGEWMFNELYSSLGAVFDAPFIWVSTVEPHSMILSLVDENLNPAYSGWAVQDLPPFTFWQRLQELLFITKITVVRETVMAYLQSRFYDNYIAPFIVQRGRVPPSFSDLKYNASLVLGNSHVSMGQATRVPQIYKPVGGYHIDENSKPLPEDLQKLLDEAKDGVIYFSMGSNLKSKDLPDQIKIDLLKMFGTLKQKVLWKFEEVLPNLPKNVQIVQWAPQMAILSHPNCVLFITHGGLLSTTETIYTGTPIIGIPVFADQFLNVNRAVSKGFAKKVPLSYTMASELKNAIQEILVDPKYTQKVKELSFIFHDRPVKPGVELVHWVDHVIKTGGAPHLRSLALHVPWYQKIFLDIALLLAIVLYVLIKLFKIVKSLVFRKKVKDGKKKN